MLQSILGNDSHKGGCIAKFTSFIFPYFTEANVSGDPTAVIPSILVLVAASIPVFLPTVIVANHPNFGGTIDYNNDAAPKYQGLVDNET